MILKALRERSGELSRFVPELNSNATADTTPSHPQECVAVVSRPDGETEPSYPAGELHVVHPENYR